MGFRDRRDAGKRLAAKLSEYADREDVVVLALPRGGVPVGLEVAEAIDAPLDVFVVRKVGVPGYEELALGAIGPGGVMVLNDDVARDLHRSADILADKEISGIIVREEKELVRREAAYRGDAPPLDVRGKCAILVDDGLATGASMRAAIQALRMLDPARVVVAVPVVPPSACDLLRPEVDKLFCLEIQPTFNGVGQWYDDFRQLCDAEVLRLLKQAWERVAG